MTASEHFDTPAHNCDDDEFCLQEAPQITVQSATDLRASIPYLLGFYPERSLVVLGLQDDGRVEMTIRVDAPTTVSEAIAAIAHVAPVLAHSHPNRAIVAYCDDYELGAADDVTRQRAIDDALRACETAGDLRPVLARELGMHGIDAIFVWPDRPGMPREATGQVPQIAVEHVVAGKRLLRDRAAVRERLESTPGPSRRLVARRIRELRGIPLARVELIAGVTDHLEMLAQSREAGRSAPALEPHEVAMCILAVRDLTVRDIVLTLIAQERAWTDEDFWCRIVQLTPTEYLPGTATMAAITAYLGGNGALAACALDLALRHDPGYSLALMMESTLRAGVHPNEVRAVIASTLDDLDEADLAVLDFGDE